VLNLDGGVVIFGGGQVGIRKVEYLSKFTKNILLVTEEALEIPEHVKLKVTSIDADDFPNFISEDTSLVVAALSDSKLNRSIADFCRKRQILVNVVDDPEPSTVIFPALSHAGELNIAISTSGKCPFFARKIREEVDSWINEKERWLEVLAPIREQLIGEDKKNEVLSKIYNDPEISDLVKNEKIEEACQKARGIVNVHSKSKHHS
jgi:siroheme synthase-like protein